MNKKTLSIIVIITILFGSIINFYTHNFLSTDFVNSVLGGIPDNNMVASFPGVFISFDVILVIIYLLRLIKNESYHKKMVGLYSIILMSFSVLGIIFSVLSGTIVYHSFVKPYPFFAYPLICLILHTMILGFGIFSFFIYRPKLDDDKETKQITVKYVFYTMGISLGIYYSLNRLGAFILSPIYIHYPTLYMTIFFYLSLLLPLSLGVYIYLKKLDLFRNKSSLLMISIILGLNVILSLLIFIIGSQNTIFISAISPALGIERIMTKPIITVGQFIIILIITILYFIIEIKLLIKNKKN